LSGEIRIALLYTVYGIRSKGKQWDGPPPHLNGIVPWKNLATRRRFPLRNAIAQVCRTETFPAQQLHRIFRHQAIRTAAVGCPWEARQACDVTRRAGWSVRTAGVSSDTRLPDAHPVRPPPRVSPFSSAFRDRWAPDHSARLQFSAMPFAVRPVVLRPGLKIWWQSIFYINLHT